LRVFLSQVLSSPLDHMDSPLHLDFTFFLFHCNERNGANYMFQFWQNHRVNRLYHGANDKI
jgi:hypothetical protein